MEEAGVPYLVDGSLAVYLHVDHAGRGFANTTRDADVAFHCDGVQRVEDILRRIYLRYEILHGGFSISLEADGPFEGGTIRMFSCVGSAVANSTRFPSGIKVVTARDFIRAKLERASLEDQLYIKNLDGARIVTPEIEESLPETLRAKLAKIRRLP